MAGKDASKQFWKYHNEGILKKYKGQLQIGSLDTKKAAAAPEPAPAASASVTASSKSYENAKPARSEAALDVYGDLIPFADPAWYQGVSEHLPNEFRHAHLCPLLTYFLSDSTTLPISMRLTLLFGMRCANGLTLRSSLT